MKEPSIFDVAFILFLGATLTTIIFVGGWWKHWITPAASAIQQESLSR